MEDDINGALNG